MNGVTASPASSGHTATSLSVIPGRHAGKVVLVTGGARGIVRHLRRGGRIITMGSVTAHHFPNDSSSLYGMTKAAVASLVRGRSRGLCQRAGR